MNRGLRGILSGAAPLAALEALSLLLALVTLPWLMRVLGPAGFGRYAFGVAVAGLLALLIDWGFNTLGARAAARTPEQGSARGTLFWAVQGAKLQLALLSLPLLAAAAVMSGWAERYGSVLPAAAWAAVSALLLPQWFLQGTLRLRTLALSLAAARGAVALATVWCIRQPEQAALAVALQASTGALAGLLALLDPTYRRALRWRTPDWRDSWRWLRRGRGLFGSTLAVAAYSTAVPVLLGTLASPAALGLFSAGDKVRAAMQALLAPLGAAAFPHFSRWLHDDRSSGLARARSMLRLQLALAVPAALLVVLAAEPALELVAGDTFLPAVPAAQLLGLCLVCTAVSNTLGMQVMLGLDMERSFTAVLIAGAAFGLVAVTAGATRWQATGAAAGVLATEALVALLMALLLWRRGVYRGRAR